MKKLMWTLWIFHSIYWNLSHIVCNESRADKKKITQTANIDWFYPSKILNFINQNLAALGSVDALLPTVSQSHILLFQYNLQWVDLG